MIEDVDDAVASTRPWLEDPPTVTAVVVVRNGDRWLPRVLASLAAQEFGPTQVVAVDLESTDASRVTLSRVLPPSAISSAAAKTGFGDAVQIALDSAVESSWVWLVHDDCAPEPDALAHLLDQATLSPDVAVVGPKLREWPSLRRLLEVGVTIMGTGRRDTGLERGEPDQGQHDRARDVLAVSTAGMLVRRDVWDDLDGLDPRLPLFCDDIDFGWRVARRGHRVRVAPRAVVFHVEASVQGIRDGTTTSAVRREQRRSALYTLLVNASAMAVVWQWFRLLFGSLMRAVGLLLAKAPLQARDEVLAMLAVHGRPWRILSGRRRRAATATRSAKEVRALLPPPSLPYRHGLDAIAEVVVATVRPSTESTGRRAAIESGPASEDAEDLTPQVNLLVRHPWLTVVSVVAVLAAIAARGLIGSGSLLGGALLPAPSSATTWWQLFFERSHDVGVGSATAAPPYVVALAVPATALWQHAGLVVDLLMLGSVPLAALTAHRLARRMVTSPWIQAWWAITYATLLVASGAVAQGRIGTVAALVAAPAVVGSTMSLLRSRRLQDGFRVGLWLALATAFAPIAYPMAAVGILAAGLVVLRGRARMAVVVALVLPWALLGSWMWTRALDPSAWWWEAGDVDARIGRLDPSAWQLALARADGVGAAPAWIGLGILVAGVLALLRTDRSAAILAAWGVGLIGLAAAVLGAGSTVTVASTTASVWVGFPVVLWLAALAAAAAIAADGARGFLAGRRFGLVQPLAVAVLLAASLAPLAVGVWWVARSVEDPLRRGAPTDVPAYLVTRAESGRDTLVIRGTRARGVDYTIFRGDGDRLGDEAVRPDRGDSAPFSRLVTRLLSNPSVPVLDRLAGYGIRAVYLASPADNELADVLDTAPGLSPSGSPSGSRVWTFTAPRPVPHEQPRADRRPLVAAGQLSVLVLAAVAATPGRRREPQ